MLAPVRPMPAPSASWSSSKCWRCRSPAAVASSPPPSARRPYSLYPPSAVAALPSLPPWRRRRVIVVEDVEREPPSKVHPPLHPSGARRGCCTLRSTRSGARRGRSTLRSTPSGARQGLCPSGAGEQDMLASLVERSPRRRAGRRVPRLRHRAALHGAAQPCRGRGHAACISCSVAACRTAAARAEGTSSSRPQPR